MTGKDAAEILKTFRITGDKHHEALDVAIKALKQEPCEDAISREDALMCLTGEIKETDTIETIIARSGRRIKSLPSVKPQEPCEDAIGRSDMLDAIGHGTTYTSEELQRIIKALPPVNPQPCGDLISRKAILEEFENDQYHLEFCKEHHIERSISMEMVRIRLHDLPPVNPQNCDKCEVGNPCLYCKHEYEP